MENFPALKLNDGNQIPLLAFGSGTAHLRTKRAKGDTGLDRDCVEAVKTAIRVGYRHLDNAELYETEAEVGVAIAESLAEGVIKSRSELFITSKVERDPLDAEKAIDRCLSRFGPGIEYLDLFLIHSPYFATSDAELQAAWAAMERIKADGRARSIGLSNYEARHIKATIVNAKTLPAINQIEYHPYMTVRDGQPLLEQLRVDGIAVSAYGALTPMTKNIPGPLDEVLQRLSKTLDVSPGVICIRWCMEQDVVVITTSQKEERMKEYSQAASITLSTEQVEDITNAGLACLEGKGELKPRVVHYLESIKEKK